ncbi:MAG: lasso RiPP family leader peptide-containing protein [Hyphomonadaceae bacterium]
MDTRTEYEAPELTEIGSFEEITQGMSRGRRLDASFPTETPFENLTFS